MRWSMQMLSVFTIVLIIASSSSILADSSETPESWSTPVMISADADFSHFSGGFDVGGTDSWVKHSKGWSAKCTSGLTYLEKV